MPLSRVKIIWEMPVIPIVILAGLAFMAIFAESLVPHNANEVVLSNRFLPPFWQPGGDTSYLLGTDHLGRCLLSRIIIGSRMSLLVIILAIAVGASVGTSLGMIAGYLDNRTLTAVIMRTADAMLAFPMILLALLLSVAIGPGLHTVVFVIGLVLWARFARLVYGEVLSWKQREFVALAKIAGASQLRIILYELLPNIANTVIVMVTLQVGFVILLEASLSFLGAGIPPPTPTWGSMVSDGREYIIDAWWVSTLPGLAIGITVMAVNNLGDWLRDKLDPKLRQI